MIQRFFYPGDEWVFFKIYTSPLIANSLLLNRVYPLVQQWMDTKVIDSWFFIRYFDPNSHLRIRVRVVDISLLGKVISEMRTALAEETCENLISSIQIDTYQREIERYGEDNMERCEDFFRTDSDDVMEIIKTTDTEKDLLVNTIIWMFKFLLSVNMSESDILDFIKNMARRYQKEFSFSTEHIKIINLKYREMRPFVVEHLKQIHDSGINDSTKYVWINSGEKNNLIPSLVHMHINRLFTVNQRVYEFMCYHMLTKAYDSVIKQIR